MNDTERLAAVLDLLTHLPIVSAGSAEEPWVKLDLINVTKVIEVAAGAENPADWVATPCGRDHGHHKHWWSEYREGQKPLRVPHWCDGTAS